MVTEVNTHQVESVQRLKSLVDAIRVYICSKGCKSATIRVDLNQGFLRELHPMDLRRSRDILSDKFRVVMVRCRMVEARRA